eukprot:7453489-Lingulodinium_polyedra.AAC.1
MHRPRRSCSAQRYCSPELRTPTCRLGPAPYTPSCVRPAAHQHQGCGVENHWRHGCCCRCNC